MMQSAFSPRKISEKEADEWLKSAKIERVEREQERERNAVEMAEMAEHDRPGGILRWVAMMLLVWAGFFALLMGLRACWG